MQFLLTVTVAAVLNAKLEAYKHTTISLKLNFKKQRHFKATATTKNYKNVTNQSNS